VDGSEYTAVAHARVPGDNRDLVWVAIGRWAHPDGSVAWCLEYWDAQGGAADDTEVVNADSAKTLALERLGVPVDAWRDGPQPFTR
jgi:hypothetical protein